MWEREFSAAMRDIVMRDFCTIIIRIISSVACRKTVKAHSALSGLSSEMDTKKRICSHYNSCDFVYYYSYDVFLH